MRSGKSIILVYLILIARGFRLFMSCCKSDLFNIDARKLLLLFFEEERNVSFQRI